MNDLEKVGGIVVAVSACIAVVAIIYAVFRMYFFDED